MSTQPVPFVVGAARSGTTLLRAMLDAHPDLAVPGESHFIVRMLATRHVYEQPWGVDVHGYRRALARERYFAAWGLPAPDLRDALVRANPRSLEDAMRATFRAYARRQGKQRWGDKTPSYVLHVRAIAGSFPEARILHVIRDGRDVARSMVDLGWAASHEDAVLRWAHRVRRGRKEGARLGERYVEVRYEDLVGDPIGTLTRLCVSLDLPFDPAMTQPHRRADEILATLANPENHQRIRRPPSRVRDWRTEMDSESIRKIESVAGDLLTELGYELGGPPATLPLRVAARSASLRSLPRRMGSRWRRTLLIR
ncbi:MAG TPA: sulfotransferase [Actinomycetota bacterium]|nr:sulfotransferase [Actinomycetota bacterium]